MTDYTCGVCRESDSKPWQVYIAEGADLSMIYPATAYGLLEAIIYHPRYPAKFLREVTDTFRNAMLQNGAEQ